MSRTALPFDAIRAGDRVLALEPGTGQSYLLHADGKGTRKEKGMGIVDPDRLVGLPYGTVQMVGAKRVALLRPALPDLVATLQRKAQIITPKDASRIVFELGVGAGDRVLESGIGSGAATMLLAWAVGPTGQVVAQELREEFADWARANLERAGLAARLATAIGDLTQGLAAGVEGPFQAVLLDQPEPWLALPHVVPALAAGARVACYTPQVSQMEQAAKALQSLGFAQVRCLELIERGWEVKEKGSRPSFEGLGHTGFLVFARWLGTPVAPPTPA
ncbi:MAG: tRNA (adenine57-N1/adenine58-N1)-methyltransferase catalytic subunit [Thermoplasmata archaeon]|nr:tRNA (adenine57-N1/adenine58-N1)-methyltransferase catalytic subunit [Thermoplasmata archaeon]